MGCDKRYGLRDVWIAAEASPNTPGVFTEDNYLQRCTGSNFPALYREALENQEATGNRGQSLSFDGAQAELSWDVTVMIPSDASIYDPTGLPASLQALFWSAGFGSDAGGSEWQPEMEDGPALYVKAGSACGRTIQLIGLDRDRRQLEMLTGAVVSQVVFSFSRGDVCTIQFSGVAAQKYEATAPIVAVADYNKTTQPATVRSSFAAVLPTSPATLTGLSLELAGDSEAVTSFDGRLSTIKIASGFANAITAATQSLFSLAKPDAENFYPVLSPDSWTVSSTFNAVQSATVTMETGNTYGELTTEAQYPTEILSGQVKVSASITAYITDNNVDLSAFDTGSGFSIFFTPYRSDAAPLSIGTAKITERPAIDLSSVDTPASGDFSFAAGETGTYLPTALDTLFFGT